MSRITLHSALLAIAIAGVATAATAQDSPPDARAATCPAPLEPLSDAAYTTDTLILALDPGYGIKPVDSMVAMNALATVNDDLTLPAPLALPPVIVQWFHGGPSVADDQPGGGAQGFMAEAFVELERSGKVKRVGLTQTSLVGSIDAALVAAVQKAADEGAFLPYKEGIIDRSAYVFVQLRTMPIPTFTEKARDYTRPDADALVPTPYGHQEQVKKKGAAVVLPIRVLHVPIVRLTSRLMVTKRGPDPVFPLGELRGRQDGFVNIEFVVGTDGKVVPGTLRLANAMTTGYAKAVIDALDRYRFKPAMAGACPVAARETYTFTFDVL
jgi:hypothetical protein